MSDMKFDWSKYYAGMGRILRGSDMQAFIAAQAAKQAAAKNSEGDGEYSCRVYNSGQRQVGFVYQAKRWKWKQYWKKKKEKATKE